ncbi:MAG: 2-oxoglutarate and iron-dependent oxygenase domain-containing protein [Alphaproteobacteria bacterium]
MPSPIPVLDLAPYFRGEAGAHPALAAEISRASETVGFTFVVGHGVPWDLVERTFEAAAQFHAQPIEAKRAFAIDEHNIGYMGFGASVTRSSAVNANTRPNLNEAVFFKRERAPGDPKVIANKRFCGMNRWPDLPGFRATVIDYCAALETLARRLVPVYAASLDLPEGFFDAAFAEPQFTLRMSHYPSVAAHGDNEFGSAPHTDSSFITLLAQSPVAGLEIRARDGAWLAAPVIPRSILVNSGDMMRRWTNHRYLSTPHRVRNVSGLDRYAIPFFFDAGMDYPIGCLPTCQSPDNPARYPPTTYAEYMTWFARKNYDHQREREGDPGAAPGTASPTSPGDDVRAAATGER